MHTPSAIAARPLPKRTRSTAGLEEIDAWLGQITSSATSTTDSTTPSSPSTTASSVFRETSFAHGASRKRHHSLPAAAIAGSLQSLASTELKPHAKFTSAPARRPELALFGGESPSPHGDSPSRQVSNQYSPSLHHPPHDTRTLDTSCSFVESHATASATSYNNLPPPLQLPEMSPREDFLVRAFVSDAMKLEEGGHDDSRHHRTDRQHHHHGGSFHPLEITTTTTAMNSSGASMSTTPIGTTTMPMMPLATGTGHPTTGQQQQQQQHHKWTREEDEKLRDAVSRFGGKSWKLIAEMLGHGRTDVQCLHRWNKVLKPGLVKGPWTPDEDRVLLSLIARYGVGQIRWCDVALHLPGRIGKQCRERWCNHLDSSIRKGQWTPQEDDTVFRLQQTIGNKWSEIAKHLPGRTENAVKNRFNSAARRKWLMGQAAAGSGSAAVGLVSPLTGAGTTTATVSGSGGKVGVRGLQPQPTARLHAAAPSGRGASGRSASALPRTSAGLLSTELLAGPPRPPPPSLSTTSSSSSSTASTFRGFAYGSSGIGMGMNQSGGFRPRAETPSTVFSFGDNSDPHHAYLASTDAIGSVDEGGSDVQPTFSFHGGHAFPSASAGSLLFRPQGLSTSVVSSPSLATLTSLLAEATPVEKRAFEPHDDPFSNEPTDSLETLGMDDDDSGRVDHGDDDGNDDNQVTHSPVRRRASTALLRSDGLDKRRLSMDGSTASPPVAIKEGHPHNGDDLDNDDHALGVMDLPDSDGEERQQGDDGHDDSPVDMDDQNMSTFLDSVALELDDMI